MTNILNVAKSVRFNLQFFNEEVSTEAAPEVDTPIEDGDGSVEGEGLELEENTEEPTEFDYKPFLDELNKTPFKHLDEEFTVESIDEIRDSVQMRKDYTRQKENNQKYKDQLAQPHYKYFDDYMKESGYDDPGTFVKDLQVGSKFNEYLEKGMSEEDAQAAATEYVESVTKASSASQKENAMGKFLDWHNQSVKEGTFKDSISGDNIPPEVIKALETGGNMQEAYYKHHIKNLTLNTQQDTIKKINQSKANSTTKPMASVNSTKQDMTVDQINNKVDGMTDRDAQKWIKKNYAAIEKSGYFGKM